MLLHRRKANAKRKELGRGPFAWGPAVTDPDATEYRFTCFDSLAEHDTDDEIDVLPSKRRRRSENASPTDATRDIRNLLDHDGIEELESGDPPVQQEPFSRTAERRSPDSNGNAVEDDVSHDRTRNMSPIPLDDANDEDNIEVLAPSPQLLVSANIATHIHDGAVSQRESTESLINENELSDIEETQPGILNHQHSLFNIEMLSWLRREQKWIHIIYEHGIEYSVMDNILRNLAAPCKSSKTTVAHLMRHSNISTSLETYQTCPGHFCFAQLPGNAAVTCCSACGKTLEELVARKEHGTVQYIPLMASIAAAVRNKESCERLYDYFHEREPSNGLLRDYFDGNAYKELLLLFGGEDNVKDDIFLAISTDGFQAFKNKRVDVWPLLGVLFNLPPSERYKVHNVLPFLFTTDGVQPKDLQSFLIPLISEIESLYREGGKLLQFYDGSMRRVRVHLICITADLAALVKLASLSGYNGKTPCRYCMIQGLYVSSARHYYFPSAVLLNENSNRRTILYNPRALRNRSAAETVDTFDRLREANSLAERQRIAKETGVTGRSILFELATITSFRSFPPDIMHLLYNVQKHLLEIQTSDLNDLFTIKDFHLKTLDEEMLAFHSGISGQLAPKPRKLSEFQNWKSAEHNRFSFSYALVLFDGYLPQQYLDGLALFVEIVDICYLLKLSQQDVARLMKICVSFFEHFESSYVRYSRSRSSLCKYTLHLLLHLAEGVQDYGPLMSVSQYWVEKYIGWIVGRNNARNLVSKSMTKRALVSESYKIFYEMQFSKELDATTVLPPGDAFVTAGTHMKVSLTTNQGPTAHFKNLLVSYLLRKFDSITIADARVIASRLQYTVGSSKLAFRSGKDVIIASVSGKNELGRPSCYVAVEMEGRAGFVDVYYGKLMKVWSIDLSEEVLHGFESLLEFAGMYTLVQCSWVSDMLKGRQGQIFKNCSRSRAFSRQTIEDANILIRLIGVVEHAVPVSDERKRMRTYFIDDVAREQGLLDRSKRSSDGLNRNLLGIYGRS